MLFKGVVVNEQEAPRALKIAISHPAQIVDYMNHMTAFLVEVGIIKNSEEFMKSFIAYRENKRCVNGTLKIVNYNYSAKLL